MSEKTLKELALLEKISESEDKIADLRVALTEVSRECEGLRNEISILREENHKLKTGEIVEGEVVEEEVNDDKD